MRKDRQIVNCYLVWIWEEAITDYFKIPFWHFPVETEENHKISVKIIGHPVSGDLNMNLKVSHILGLYQVYQASPRT
jgi:hypothetical protein